MPHCGRAGVTDAIECLAERHAIRVALRKQVLDANPKLAEYLNALSAKLDDATMARLNASVDVDKKTVEDVARTFLKEQGLV